MDEAVDRSDGHGLIREDAVPSAEGLVGGDHDGAALVARGDKLEEDAGLGVIFLDIGQVVEDQQVELVELGDVLGKREVLACRLQPLDEIRGSGEQHPVALLDERMAECGRQVALSAKGKTDTARAWVYVRDDAPFGGPDPPAALFRYARDRSGDHPVEHLQTFAGILQADAYAGYRRLYAAGRSPGPVIEALCWAHGRRKFYEFADIAANKRRGKRAPPISPLALEAVKRIDVLFDIEREINGEPAERRLAVRQERSAPLVAELEEWMRMSSIPEPPLEFG